MTVLKDIEVIIANFCWGKFQIVPWIVMAGHANWVSRITAPPCIMNSGHGMTAISNIVNAHQDCLARFVTWKENNAAMNIALMGRVASSLTTETMMLVFDVIVKQQLLMKNHLQGNSANLNPQRSVTRKPITMDISSVPMAELVWRNRESFSQICILAC